MFGRSRAFAAIAAGAGALMLGAAAPATAAPVSDGATPYRYDECFDYGVYEYCYSARGEFNIVNTPSGNSVFQANSKLEVTITYPDGTSTSSESSSHFRNIWQKGEEQVYHSNGRGSYEFDGRTCTYTYVFHYTDGVIRIANYKDSCFS